MVSHLGQWRPYGTHDTSDAISQSCELQLLLPSVKNMVEEGFLEHDHITVNTTIYKQRQSCDINYC